MFSIFSARKSPTRAKQGRPKRHRPRVEELTERTLPSGDIAVLSAQLVTPTTVQFTYQTTDDPGPFTVGVYWSADAVFDATDRLLTTATVNAPSAPEGSSWNINLAGEIPINPARPYVLVVADPAGAIPETDEENNTASFRKLALGVVTHGVELDGMFPPWVTAMSAALEAKGYADTIAFDWAAASRIPVPGLATVYGIRMAEEIRQTADALGTLPNDVIDVHLIGHSRGAVVVSQALLALNAVPGPPELQLGYTKVTLLDPHPARNRAPLFFGLLELYNGTGVSTIGGFSFDPRSAVSVVAAVATLQFQAAVHDPRVVLPPNVDATEMYYQRLPWYQTTTPVEQELRFNIWGDRPQDIVNLSGQPLVAINLAIVPSAVGVGHTGVQFWYLGTLLAE
jgi:pimeloyl-ACP methyl ester carboxylesterase